MKKKILSIAAGLVLTVLTTTSFAGGTTPTAEAKITPEEKAINSFQDQFGNSVTPVLYWADNGGIILQAEVAGRQVTSAFSGKGNWVYTIERYPSENLSKDIIDLVQRDFDTRGYYITTMEKVNQPGDDTVFIVHLTGTDSYKTLRVSNNKVELVEDLHVS